MNNDLFPRLVNRVNTTQIMDLLFMLLLLVKVI